MTLQAAGRDFELSSPGKVFFAERGDTKLDLAEYYLAVEAPLMAAMGGRPVLLQRFPDGAGGKSFFQKRVPKNHPDWLATATVSTPNGTTSEALVIADVAHVLYAVNMGCLGFHVWPSKAADLDHADELRIDLDPTPGVNFAMIREAAGEVRAPARRARHRGPSQDQRQQGPAHLRPAPSPAGTPTRCAPRRWRWPASSSAAVRTC